MFPFCRDRGVQCVRRLQRERHIHQSLRAIKGVRSKAWPNQVDPLDLICLRALDLNCCVVVNLLWRVLNHRTRVFPEKIGWAENFKTHFLEKIGRQPVNLGTLVGITSSGNHATIGQQKCDRMIEACHDCRCGNRPYVRCEIVNFAFENFTSS